MMAFPRVARFYHLVGPVSVVAVFAPTNGLVAAAILKYFINNGWTGQYLFVFYYYHMILYMHLYNKIIRIYAI